MVDERKKVDELKNNCKNKFYSGKVFFIFILFVLTLFFVVAQFFTIGSVSVINVTDTSATFVVEVLDMGGYSSRNMLIIWGEEDPNFDYFNVNGIGNYSITKHGLEPETGYFYEVWDSDESEMFFSGMFNTLSEEDLEPLFAGGNGTELNPYQISTCQQLTDIDTSTDSYFELINDIDCNVAPFNDIGFVTIESEFNGVLEGNNYLITMPDVTNGALFADVQYARIQNLHIIGNFTSASVVLWTRNTVYENITLDVNITSSGRAGSLIAYAHAYNTIKNVHAFGNIQGGSEVGGIIGYAYAFDEVLDSSFNGNIYATGNYIGGVMGRIRYGTIRRSSFKGTIFLDVIYTREVGGIVSLLGQGSYVYDSYAAANITINPTSSNYNLVGIAKMSHGGAGIYNSYFTGFLLHTSHSPHLLSSGVGYIRLTAGVRSNSFYDNETFSDYTVVYNESAKTLAEMWSISTYNDTDTDGLTTPWNITTMENFDGSTIWYIDDGNDFPRLHWEYPSEPVLSKVVITTTTGQSDNFKYLQTINYLNITVDKEVLGINITVVDSSGNTIIDNQPMTNYTLNDFTYNQNFLLSSVGEWNVTFSAYTSDITVSEKVSFTVSTVVQELTDDWYGYSDKKILTLEEMIDLSAYNYLIFEQEDNISTLFDNWSLFLNSVNNSRTLNIKSGLNIVLDFNYNDTDELNYYLDNITAYFPSLLSVPYTDAFKYVSLELVDAENYNDTQKTFVVNKISNIILNSLLNNYPVYSKNYNVGLDNSYVRETIFVYMSPSTGTEFIDEQMYNLKNKNTLNRIYYNLDNDIKSIASNFHSRIFQKLRSGINMTEVGDNIIVLNNGDIIVFNNQTTEEEINVNATFLTQFLDKTVWNYNEHNIIERMTNLIFNLFVPGYSATIVIFEDLNYIRMTSPTSGLLFKGASSDVAYSNHTNGTMEGNWALYGALDVAIELFDPHYVHTNFITYYGWLNVSRVNHPEGWSNYDVVIFGDLNADEIAKFDFNKTDFYGYISVADYSDEHQYTWLEEKKAEVDAWLDANENLHLFLDGLDYSMGGLNFSVRMKDLADYVQIDRGRLAIFNTYTAYEDFATWGWGGIMKESCVNRWDGVNVMDPTYYREDWQLEIERAQWFQTHNVPVFCQAFADREQDHIFDRAVIADEADVQNIYFASKVLGYDYFYIAQPDFQNAYELYVYDLGEKLGKSFGQLTEDPDVYYRHYEKGIVYYNVSSGEGWVDDGLVINNREICFYLYNAHEGGTDLRFTINDLTMSTSGQYSIPTDWAPYTWEWVCADISDVPTSWRYLVQAWVGARTVTAGQGVNIGYSETEGSGQNSWWDASAGTNSFTAYQMDRNWMVNMSQNITKKISVDIVNDILQTNNHDTHLKRFNVKLSSDKHFPIDIISLSVTIPTTENISIYFKNNESQWQELSTMESEFCDTADPIFNNTEDDGVYYGSCFVSNGTHTTFKFKVSELSEREFLLDYLVDEEEPYIEIISPADGSTLFENEIALDILAADNTQVDTVWYNINGTNITYDGFDILTLDDGEYTITAWANDTVGNINSTSSTFNIMSVSPTIHYIEHLDWIRNGMCGNFVLNRSLDFLNESHYLNSSNMDDYITGEGWNPIGDSFLPFVGYFNGSGHTISNLYINRPSQNSIGLFGEIYSECGNLTGVHNLGLINVSITGNSFVGGITGRLEGQFNGIVEIQNSYVHGEINGNGNTGGLVGYMSQRSFINNSYTDVDINGGWGRGGISGALWGGNNHITNSLSISRINSGSGSGGIIGQGTAANVINSFWDTNVTAAGSTGGTGLTTEQLQRISTFNNTGWDISYNETELNNGYPYLGWQIGADTIWISSNDFVYGCSDPEAVNYNPLTDIEDGSCIYPNVYNIDKDQYYNAIMDAVNDADEYDTLQLFEMIYNENLLINKSLNIIGAGIDESIILNYENDTSIVHFNGTSENIIEVSISNLTIDHNYSTSVSSSGYVYGIRAAWLNNSNFDNLKIINLGDNLQYERGGVSIVDSSNTNITNIHVENISGSFARNRFHRGDNLLVENFTVKNIYNANNLNSWALYIHTTHNSVFRNIIGENFIGAGASSPRPLEIITSNNNVFDNITIKNVTGVGSAVGLRMEYSEGNNFSNILIDGITANVIAGGFDITLSTEETGNLTNNNFYNITVQNLEGLIQTRGINLDRGAHNNYFENIYLNNLTGYLSGSTQFSVIGIQLNTRDPNPDNFGNIFKHILIKDINTTGSFYGIAIHSTANNAEVYNNTFLDLTIVFDSIIGEVYGYYDNGDGNNILRREDYSPYAPTLIVTSPTAINYEEVEILISMSAEDLFTEVESLWYEWNDTIYEYNEPINFNFTEGENTLKAYANNSMGDVTEEVITFNVVLETETPPSAPPTGGGGGSTPPSGQIIYIEDGETVFVLEETEPRNITIVEYIERATNATKEAYQSIKEDPTRSSYLLLLLVILIIAILTIILYAINSHLDKK